ncbi:regulator of MON1-CCZ1 complex [Neltuma alba]|uniref:regulator of MON1-CCZ1 complex n=1 Tax=Neltuma alba TaxID=207710 RepID=UPI0010A3750E|nr:regulator of MON1-CCZ1 complex [Prosopis alba]XP_028777548.1 regulator of MON1-CCZ1 complex [Prosopis alba]
MSGTASSSKPNIDLSGSGGLSHAYIQYPPLQCNNPGSKGLFYDDGNKLLLSPTSDQVFSWKVVPFDPHVGPTIDSITEGPIISIRYSLDVKVIAIQRSDHEIQFQNRETGETFTHTCRTESESILGFFWTDSHICDIVLVKTSGLDMYAYKSDSKSLQLVEAKKLNVSWYAYTHESRLVLLATGMQCKTFHGFQISSADIVRLPRFEMVMAKSEANSKPVLAAEDIYIVTVYGRIYCLQFDRVAMLLHSYRLYRDAVIPQGSLPIYSGKIAVSVVDNVLLIHQVDAKVVILYDIFADSRAPISAPLPLLLRGLPRSNSFSSRSTGRESESLDANLVSNHGAVTYADAWSFLVPDLICDGANKLLWKIQLDLEAISASSSEVSSVLEFLQRRKLEASKAKQLCLGIVRTLILERRPVSMVAKAIHVLITSYSHSVKTNPHLRGTKSDKTSATGAQHAVSPLSGAVVSALGADALGKSIMHESAARVDSGSLHKSSTVLSLDSEGEARSATQRRYTPETQAHSAHVTQSSLQSGQEEPQLSSPAISPDEMYSFVFAPVDEETVGDPSYLVTIIIEFLHSANAEKVRVLPNLYALTIQLLARNERYAELGLFVINKILEPSREVAVQLLESGRQNSQTRKLGLDMLRQLGLHQEYVLLLVQDGYYLEALRYARKYKVDTIRPSLFLEAAFVSKDPQHLAAVLRFLSDFLPGFKHTSEHNRYYRILNDMSTPVSV